MERRKFVRRSLELVIAARCLPLLDEAAAALQPRSSAKSLLTEASLNAIIPKDTDQLRALTRQAFPDMKAFIRSRFVLSAEQDRALGAISTESIERIRTAVEGAITKGASVSVTMPSNTEPVGNVRVQNSADAEVRIALDGCQRVLNR